MNWKTIAGDVTGVLFAFETCGASLLISPSAQKFVKSIFGAGSEDDTTKKLDEIKAQNDQFKVLMDAHEAELKRKEEERKEQEKNLKFNNDEIDRLRSIINNPHSSDEEKKNAKARLVLLEDENKKIRKALNKLTEEIKNQRNSPPPLPTRPWSLPKLSVFDKLILAGGISLMVYVAFIKEERKK